MKDAFRRPAKKSKSDEAITGCIVLYYKHKNQFLMHPIHLPNAILSNFLKPQNLLINSNTIFLLLIIFIIAILMATKMV